MAKHIIFYLLIASLVACSPTLLLNIETVNPAEFTFGDSGKIAVLNAAYIPSLLNQSENLVGSMPEALQNSFDTLILSSVLDGFFSVTNESPNEKLRNAEYFEYRQIDSTNFLGPISKESIRELCNRFDVTYLIVLEYYDFTGSFNSDLSNKLDSRLEISNRLLWRIYLNDGKVLDQCRNQDTLMWYEDNYFQLPELTDDLRELFYFSGENYGGRISPHWVSISRPYYLFVKNGEDVSLEREQLLVRTESEHANRAFKACYNMAVLSESEDQIEEAIKWAKKASELKQNQELSFYLKELNKRLEARDKIQLQSGN